VSIDAGILEKLKGEKGFNGKMVVGASVEDNVVVELQNLGVFDHLPGAQFKTVTTNIAKILWEARDDSAVFAFPARVASDWQKELPVMIENPSSATATVVGQKLVESSATINLCALRALECCLGEDKPLQVVTDCASNILNTLKRFSVHEDAGLFGRSRPCAHESRETSLITESLCRGLGTVDETVQLKWMHQLTDCGKGFMDIVLYVSCEDKTWIPVGIIEAGFIGNNKKKWQSRSYGINISHQLASAQQGLLVAELLLDRNYTSDPKISLGSLAPARTYEKKKGRMWTASIWSGCANDDGLSRVLHAFVQAARINRNPPADGNFVRIGANACKSDEWIYKCYDYRVRKVGEYQRRSADLYFEYLSNVEKVVEAENVTLIRYQFIRGSHVASSVSQVIVVLNQLLKMHSNGHCHGDIRAFNMVFGKASKLIDFDFSGDSSSKRYPEGYNIDIPDGARHDGAKAGCKLHVLHDLYSFGAVMKLFECDEGESWNSAIQKLQKERPNGGDALTELKHIKDVPLKATAAYSTLVSGNR